jgi:hypothetical protein
LSFHLFVSAVLQQQTRTKEVCRFGAEAAITNQRSFGPLFVVEK